MGTVRGVLTVGLAILMGVLFCSIPTQKAYGAGPNLENPILFVTQAPFPNGFGTSTATFGNHLASLDAVPRGGDLYIRYEDGTLKNLTAAAGYGMSGLQGDNAISVRDPAVHWSGEKALFSMVRGAPSQQYDYSQTYRWQIYEITGLGQNQTPVITKVANQPSNYNNISPVYGSEDNVIIFASDRPRTGEAHLYPQRDEYESSPIVSGLWRLNTVSADLRLLIHTPSGAFDPIIDSYGRIIFTQWDHLQRDQQNKVSQPSFNAKRFSNESASATVTPLANGEEDETFPEPRDADEVMEKYPNATTHTFNQFFPWQLNQDGTEHETLNHIGRHELSSYFARSFTNDPNLDDFYMQVSVYNDNRIDGMFQIQEDPSTPGTFVAISAPEFGTHSAGQIFSINGAPTVNPDLMKVTYLTHPDTGGPDDTPSVNHVGLFRDPLFLEDGKLIASHTSSTQEDTNIGTGTSPASRYALRLKSLIKSGSYYVPNQNLTPGITKSISYWTPDVLISYSNVTMWELFPVEVRARTKPSATQSHLPSIENVVLAEEGVDIATLKDFLEENNLALLTMRNLTTRDDGDFQQPFNLRVPGGITTKQDNGKLYDVQFLQFFKNAALRGYDGAGRRGLPVPLDEALEFNLDNLSGPEGSVEIFPDGSAAAFVPARRAMSWQMTSPAGVPVVRERYWLTFQPGEIRMCASCHGVNTDDQAGASAPTNAPEALRALLQKWKGGSFEKAVYSLTLPGNNPNKVKAGKPLTLALASNRPAKTLKLFTKIGNYQCPSAVGEFVTDENGEVTLSVQIHKSLRGRKLRLQARSGTTIIASILVKLKGQPLPKKKPAGLCGKIGL